MENGSNDNEPQGLNKVLQYIYYFRFLIFGAGLTVLFVVGMWIGALRACDGHALQNWQCMEPRMVDMVAVCEYNDFSCSKNCRTYIVNDMEEFRKTYTSTACLWLPPG